MRIEINLTGGTFKHKSGRVSRQITRNFWPQFVEDAITRFKYILESWVGTPLFGTADGIGRGMFTYNNLLYRVCGTTLYSVTSDSSHTPLATIPGTEKCIFDAIQDQVIIVTERRAFVWNTTSMTLTENEDPDLESPDSVTTINNQVIFDGDQDRFGVTNVGDALAIDGLNYATAESKADNLVRVYAYDQRVYMFGEKTIEVWWNSGVGKPPFDRVQDAIVEVGLGSLHGVASNENDLFFFGDDKKIYSLKGTTKTVLSDESLVNEISKFSDTSDAILWCMDMRNKNFLVAQFPTGNKTYVKPDDGQWFEWSSGVEGGRFIGNSYIKAYGKHLVEDYRNGNVYELDFDTNTENGETIIRQRDTAPIDAVLLGGEAGKTVFMNKLIFNVETGVGLISGQGSDPVLMVSYSDDGGKTFSTERWVKIGKMGKFKWVAQLNNLGSFKERILRIRTSDPDYFCIRSCYADVEFGI